MHNTRKVLLLIKLVDSCDQERLVSSWRQTKARLSTLDKTMHNASKVLLLIKLVDSCDQEKFGLLLETEKGLTTDWAVVKRV